MAASEGSMASKHIGHSSASSMGDAFSGPDDVTVEAELEDEEAAGAGGADAWGAETELNARAAISSLSSCFSAIAKYTSYAISPPPA